MKFNKIQESCFGAFFSRVRAKRGLPDPVAEKMIDYLLEIREGVPVPAGGDSIVSFRSIYMDALIKKEIDSGRVKTIFNAGCGFCTRYWRLGVDKTDILWVDCDQLEIMQIKEKALIHCKIDFPDNYVMTHANFYTEPFPPSFDLYIAEGLFMWLPISFIKRNIHGRTIFDVIGENRKGGVAKTRGQKWHFSPQDTIWDPIVIESIEAVGNVHRDQRVVVAYPK